MTIPQISKAPIHSPTDNKNLLKPQIPYCQSSFLETLAYNFFSKFEKTHSLLSSF